MGERGIEHAESVPRLLLSRLSRSSSAFAPVCQLPPPPGRRCHHGHGRRRAPMVNRAKLQRRITEREEQAMRESGVSGLPPSLSMPRLKQPSIFDSWPTKLWPRSAGVDQRALEREIAAKEKAAFAASGLEYTPPPSAGKSRGFILDKIFAPSTSVRSISLSRHKREQAAIASLTA